MTITDLIRHHHSGADTCKAFADTPAAKDQKTKDIAKRYEKRAKWHQEAVGLLEGMSQPRCKTASGKECPGDGVGSCGKCPTGRKPMPSVAPTPPPPVRGSPAMFQFVPEGGEPDPDKWETLGNARMEPFPASDL